MSETAFRADERLLTFEVGGAVYALPIDGILEVAEVDRVTFVPGLPKACGSVMNWHGDALPLLYAPLLLAEDGCEGDESRATEVAAPSEGRPGVLATEYALVISDRTEVASLALRVDRVIGFEAGGVESGRTDELVVERRTLAGRSVSVLDPRRLVARALEVIEAAHA